MKYPKEFVVRFWARVRKAKGCWIWLGYKARTGYGMLQCRAVSVMPMYAHRVSWELANGPIKRGLHALHRCDNPPCVRPSHLFLGTMADNSRDMWRKGRGPTGDRSGARTRPERNPFVRNRGSGLRGERHPMARLTDKEVREIRFSYKAGARKVDLAKRYGISQTHAGRIVKGRSW